MTSGKNLHASFHPSQYVNVGKILANEDALALITLDLVGPGERFKTNTIEYLTKQYMDVWIVNPQEEQCMDDEWDIDWDEVRAKIRRELESLRTKRAACDEVLTIPMRY